MPPKKDLGEELREEYERARQERLARIEAEQEAARQAQAARDHEEDVRRRVEAELAQPPSASDASDEGKVKSETEKSKSEKDVKMSTEVQFDNPEPLSI